MLEAKERFLGYNTFMSSLKNIFFIFIVFLNFLYANDVHYSFHLSNTEPYEKEPVVLEVNLTQTDSSKVMLFNFSLKTSNNYESHQVDFKEHEKYHDLRHEYVYLIYPKKSGEILLQFNMTKSITDDAKVAYSISGDRDSVKGLEKEEVVVDLKPLTLEVKSLPSNVQLVGDFTLKHKLDKQETESYDPVNLQVNLKGKGYLNSFELFEDKKAYRLFSQSPIVKKVYTKSGLTASLEWDYAISAKESFTLPKISIKAFNPNTEKVYDLGFPAYAVKVTKVDEALLLDKVDSPVRSKGIDWDFWSWIFSYVVVFVAGLLMPRDLFKRKKILEKNDQEILEHKIKEAKSHKALLEVLLLENSHDFKDAIKDLESVVYNGKNISLSKIKNSIN